MSSVLQLIVLKSIALILIILQDPIASTVSSHKAIVLEVSSIFVLHFTESKPYLIKAA